jgi:hypothetical protein
MNITYSTNLSEKIEMFGSDIMFSSVRGNEEFLVGTIVVVAVAVVAWVTTIQQQQQQQEVLTKVELKQKT